MDTNTLTTLIADLAPNDLLEKVKAWNTRPAPQDIPDFAGWFKALVAENKKELDAKEVATLRVVLFYLALRRETSCFQTLYDFLSTPAATALKSDDWMVQNMHRILASLAGKDDISYILCMIGEKSLTQDTREQAYLAFHFLWLEGVIDDPTAIKIYKDLIKDALENGTDERIAMALALNAAVVGGPILRSEVAAILDADLIHENADMIAKAVQAIMTNGRQFREIYMKEHKGFFTKPEDEIPHIHEPVVENLPTMPGKGKPVVRQAPKIGRNDPCPCGSGKKYKKCCGANH